MQNIVISMFYKRVDHGIVWSMCLFVCLFSSLKLKLNRRMCAKLCAQNHKGLSFVSSFHCPFKGRSTYNLSHNSNRPEVQFGKTLLSVNGIRLFIFPC